MAIAHYATTGVRLPPSPQMLTPEFRAPIGSVLVATIVTAGTVLLPADWTLQASYSSAAGDGSVALWTTVVTASSPTAWACTGGSVYTETVSCYTGVNGFGPGIGRSAADFTSSPCTAPTAGTLIYLSFEGGTISSAQPTSFSTPAGCTVRMQNTTPYNAYNGTNTLVVDRAVAAAGSQPTVATSSSSIYGGGSFTLPLLDQAPPFAPAQTGPAANAYVDLAGTPTFAWAYHPQAAGNTQTAYAVRRKTGTGAYQWWSGTAWGAAETFIMGSAGSIVFPAGAWADGTTYQWSVATTDQGGTGAYSPDSTVTGSAAPTVTVTAPSGSASTTQPTITWTDALQAGAAQTAYRTIVYTAEQYTSTGFLPGSGPNAYDSGPVRSAVTSQQTAALPNGTTYRAYVQVTQTGGQTSAWASSGFTLQVGAPAAPGVYIAYDQVTARVGVLVQSNDAAGAFGGVTTATVYRDGVPVRGATGVTLTPGTSVHIDDYEATPQVAAVYTATVTGLNQGYTVTSPAGAAVPITPTPTSWWLKDPTDRTANLPINPQGTFTSVITERSTAYEPLGATYPVIVSSSTSGRDAGSVALLSTSEWPALQALLTRRVTLLVQSPFGEQWYVRLMGPRSTVLSASAIGVGHRVTTVGWVQVAAP